jgi:hypothetical protein
VHVPDFLAQSLDTSEKAWQEGFVPFPPISACAEVPCWEKYRAVGTAEMAKAREKEWQFNRTSEVCAAAATAVSDATVTGNSLSRVQVCRCVQMTIVLGE